MRTFRKQVLRTRDDQITNASDLTLRQSIFPLALVTILFFLWGFAYGLLDVLNKHFQVTLHITRARSSGLQAAYFGAYPVAALTFGGYVLRNWGYKATFMLGLTLYGIGALLFWPSGHYQSFPGFCGSTFVIGCGLGTLESAANPYLTVCGPPRYAEVRLNTAQAVQSVGTIVAPLLASKVFFANIHGNTLGSVQWVYMGIAIFVFILAAVFYFSPIPEVTDADMERQARILAGIKEGEEEATDTEREVKPLCKQWSLWWAVWTQFVYVGSQVAIAGYFVNYVTEVRASTSNAQGANFLAIAQGCFAIGRFSGAFAMKFFIPRIIFLMYFTGVVIFQGAAIGTRGNTGLAMLSLVLFFESICFPTIFTFGIKGLGKYTKTGATFIVAGVSGGAVVPPLLGFTADRFNSTGKAMLVPFVFFLSGYSYPLAVNFYPKLRSIVDGYSGKKVDSVAGTAEKDVEGLRLEDSTTKEVGFEQTTNTTSDSWSRK